jgi:hypothetical protein
MKTELPETASLSLTDLPDTSGQAAELESDALDPATLSFVTRGVTHSEAAAVTAVLRGLLREESDRLRQTRPSGQSAWQRSQRGIRTPVTPGPGRWNNFPA